MVHDEQATCMEDCREDISRGSKLQSDRACAKHVPLRRERDLSVAIHGDVFGQIKRHQPDYVVSVLETATRRNARTHLWERDEHTRHRRNIGNTDKEVREPLRHNEGKHVPAAARLADHVALARPDNAYSVRTAVQRMAVPGRLVSLRALRALRGRNLQQFPLECWCYAHRNMLSTILCCSGQHAENLNWGRRARQYAALELWTSPRQRSARPVYWWTTVAYFHQSSSYEAASLRTQKQEQPRVLAFQADEGVEGF